MTRPVRKVGRITVAIGLVALGLALLLDNLFSADRGFTSLVLRFWPALLIGFGLEYLLFSILDRPQEGQKSSLRFDFGGTILLFLLVAATAGFNTLSTWISLNPQDYVLPGGSTRTETASVTAEGAKEVLIDVDLGRVELYPQNLNEVRVEASYTMHGWLRLKDQAQAIDQFRLTLEPGEPIRLTAKAPNESLGGLGATYRVYLPADLKVQVKTSAGSVDVQHYTGNLTLSAGLGMVRVESSSGTLEAETGSGAISIESFNGPVAAKSSAGGIHVQKVVGALQLDSGTGLIQVDEFSGGKLSAETQMGSIRVNTSTPLEADVSLRTSTGSIAARLPEASDMKVTAQTKTGSLTAPSFVNVTQNGPARSATGIRGSGAHQVSLEASLGSIEMTTQP